MNRCSLMSAILIFVGLPIAFAAKPCFGQIETLPAASEQIVASTNEFRVDQGHEKLTVNENLTEAAREFAKFMAEEAKYGHTADGRRPAERAEAAGYDYCVVRENIAYRLDTTEPSAEALAEVFVSGWKDSPDHRENMLADHIRETGVAVATKDNETFFAVQMFGRPESAKFQFEITNQLEVPQTVIFRTGDSKDEITIPGRAVLQISRCLPTKISLRSAQPQHKISDDAKFLIRRNEDGDPALQRSSES